MLPVLPPPTGLPVRPRCRQLLPPGAAVAVAAPFPGASPASTMRLPNSCFFSASSRSPSCRQPTGRSGPASRRCPRRRRSRRLAGANLERLAALKPDLILSTDYTAMAEAAAARIAPVERLTIYGAGGEPLPRAREVLLTLGRRARPRGPRRGRARRLRRGTRRPVAAPAGEPAAASHGRLHGHAPRPRFGRASLFGNAIEQLGLANAYPGTVNPWALPPSGSRRWRPTATRFSCRSIRPRRHLADAGAQPDLDRAALRARGPASVASPRSSPLVPFWQRRAAQGSSRRHWSREAA